MPGFPPIDAAYFENPSLRIGGWMVIAIERLEGINVWRPMHRLPFHPDFNRFSQIRVHRLPSLEATLDKLRRDHAERFCYRGQTGRHIGVYRGRIARLSEGFPAIDKVEIVFESLVPTLYRSIAGSVDGDWAAYRFPTKVDQISPAIRAIANSSHQPLRHLLAAYFREVVEHPAFLAREAFAHFNIGRVPLPPECCAPGTNVSLNLLQVISISQHYEYRSSMIDVTRDVDVAGWFASHRWTGELASGDNSESGVIYRFDAEMINECLSKELDRGLNIDAGLILTGLLGYADISALGEDLGSRPKAQRGGSILGFENSVVYLLLDCYSAMDVFTFPRTSLTGRETPIEKADLCPTDDPVVHVFRPEFASDSTPVSDDDLQKFLTSEGFSSSDIGILCRARSAGFL